MVLLLVFMQLTRDLFAIAKFLYLLQSVEVLFSENDLLGVSNLQLANDIYDGTYRTQSVDKWTWPKCYLIHN